MRAPDTPFEVLVLTLVFDQIGMNAIQNIEGNNFIQNRFSEARNEIFKYQTM